MSLERTFLGWHLLLGRPRPYAIPTPQPGRPLAGCWPDPWAPQMLKALLFPSPCPSGGWPSEGQGRTWASITASLAGQAALLGLTAPGATIHQAPPGLLWPCRPGQDGPTNFSPRCPTPRTPLLCWGGASTAPPPGRSGCSGVFAPGSSPLGPTLLDGTQEGHTCVCARDLEACPRPRNAPGAITPSPKGVLWEGVAQAPLPGQLPPPRPSFSFSDTPRVSTLHWPHWGAIASSRDHRALLYRMVSTFPPFLWC